LLKRTADGGTPRGKPAATKRTIREPSWTNSSVCSELRPATLPIRPGTRVALSFSRTGPYRKVFKATLEEAKATNVKLAEFAEKAGNGQAAAPDDALPHAVIGRASLTCSRRPDRPKTPPPNGNPCARVRQTARHVPCLFIADRLRDLGRIAVLLLG
jgi:hypothetical protein